MSTLLLVAHGTRDPAGAVATAALAAAVRRARPDHTVAVAFADVRRPTPADALESLPGPCVAVPLFLAAGYHARVDVPAQLAATGRTDVVLAAPLGPDPLLVAAAAQRLTAAGARRGDAVVLAVAGSSDPVAHADTAAAARRLGRVLGGPVTVATIGAGGPRVADAVAGLRAEGAERVAVASWLLAPGLFQQRLELCGADVVAAPLAGHPALTGVVLTRFGDADRRTAAA